jgi:hypothetical protein
VVVRTTPPSCRWRFRCRRSLGSIAHAGTSTSGYPPPCRTRSRHCRGPPESTSVSGGVRRYSVVPSPSWPNPARPVIDVKGGDDAVMEDAGPCQADLFMNWGCGSARGSTGALLSGPARGERPAATGLLPRRAFAQLPESLLPLTPEHRNRLRPQPNLFPPESGWRQRMGR